ncbi:SAV_2336 N-terminal domain-related protein [Limnospira platensis]|uniref:SAV_2336 N-terminal domain-related protein n=1 Tax=Limnospira platensis TaxID=118562 RepID=UPI001686694E|nr:tetratricopeptide repeat protein [Arthrospira platensis FACHB-835]
MNPNLVQALQQEFQLSAKDIADIFWLASHIDQYSESVTPANEPSPSPSAEPSSDSSSSSQTPPESPPQPVSQADNPKNPPENSPEDKSASSVSPQPPQSEIVPKPEPSQTAPGGGGLPIRLSDAPSLRGPLTLARALKPLMRRVSGGRDWVIDEVATSEQIASQGIWIPVLRPRLEPWLDLDLVIEDCVSMLLWRHTLRDLEKLLKNYGIFRDVRVWSLLTDNPEAVKIRRGIGATAKHQAPRSPRELIDPTGRRLVIVVSDCVSKVWREGKMIPILDLWAKRGSMAILQMLPEWMWKRSGLGWEALVRLQGLNPGDWNQNLKVDEFPLWWDEEVTHQVVKVPIFTLEPESVGSWARLVAGKGNVWAAGYLFKYAEHQRRRQRPNSGGELTAEKRVNGFRATASRVARKLAGLLAAAPVITLPVVRLIQATLLKESLPVNVAEVFLGGLLKPISEIDMETDPELVQYDFMPGVRELLLESVPVDETVRVIDEVSGYVARNLGFAVEDFGAILKNPRQLGEGEVQGNAIAFARVTAQILRSLGGVYVEYAEQLESPSVVEAQQTQTEEPERLFQQSLELRTELGDSPEERLRQRSGMAESWGQLGDIERNRGNWDEAERLYRQSLDLRTELGDRSGVASSWGQLGDIQRNRGNWDEAERLYLQCLELRTELGDRSGMASCWGQLGDIQRNRGNWDEAEHLYRQCLEVMTELGDRSGMASCWGQLGDIQRNRGNWDEAERLYRQSLELRNELGDRSGMASCWGQLGDIQRNRGNWDEAERLYLQCLELMTELGDRSGMASCWGQLGDIYRNRGNWDEAERLYRQSLELRTELGDRSGMASCWGQLGDIYRNRGNWYEAERLYRQSLELRTELGDRLGMGISYNSLAFVHRQLNKIPEAIAAWRAGLAICSPDRFPLEALELGRNLGNIAFDLQNWETTIEGYNQAILAIEQSRYWATSEATKRELVANSLDIYENMVQACINNQDYPQALLTVERSKSRTLLELLDSANLYPKNATNAQKQRISDLRRQIGSYQQQLAYTPTTENNLNQPSPETLIRQQLQSANEQLQDLLTELDDPNFTLTAQVPAQLPDLRRLLPPQTALIEWYLPSEAESGFYAFLVTRRRDQQIQITPHHFSAEDRQHLDQALKDYRSDYGKPSWNQQLPQRLETLSAALQLPRLLAELSEIQHLILIPHRELHLIPLHALPVSLPSPSGSETKPLQDWFPVQYAPSCQILNYLQNLPPVNREIAPFFAIQNPTEDLDYENLGVELLCRKFSPHQVLRHDQARLANLTEPDTQTFLEQSHAVHFACHGEFDVCNPLNAYLRLANGEKLTFVDIVTSLSLPVCRLLVLCSSQTGLVETSLTDDYLGLSSAFLLTGARTVVASLWNVDELAATLVTLRLYQILPDYPSVTAALQAAQTWLRGLSCDDVLDWLKHEFKATEEELEEVEDRLSLFDDPPFESPHYWAAFVAIAGPSG